MRVLFLVLALVLPGTSTNASANNICDRIAIDPEKPAGLSGRYEVIGKAPLTGMPYSGTLILGHGKHSYTLHLKLGGKVIKGQAWIEECGMDKIRLLIAHYDTRPKTEMACNLNADGDNYFRVTCKSRQGKSQSLGLEAWFQNQ